MRRPQSRPYRCGYDRSLRPCLAPPIAPLRRGMTAREALGTRSALFSRARRVIPGGVNSPVRAWRAVGDDDPFFARRGEGAYVEDVEGNRYVDWVMSWGALLFG